MKNISWWKNFNFLNDKKNISDLFNKFDNKKNYIKILEKKLSDILKVKYVVFTTSGSSALTIALRAFPLKLDSKILIPDRTWVATAHAAYNNGHKVLIEDTNDFNMNFDYTKKNVYKKKKFDAAILVNINGKNCKFESINSSKKVYIIEDCAQSFLSFRKKKLPHGHISCFSTGTTKLMNTFQGGFCTTNSKSLYQKLLLIRNHGVYDNLTDSWSMPGFNLKPTNLQCFIGIDEIKNIWKKRKKCIEINDLYKKNLNSQKIDIISKNYSSTEFPLYVQAKVNNKKRFIEYMKINKIQIRPLPPSISSANYLYPKKNKEKFKNSNNFFKKGVFLPCGPSQKISDIKRVIELINKY
tara:strand:- start:8287 stop:9348 length:1062 start_codon:yes stop_codon:yes gene_type:complete